MASTAGLPRLVLSVLLLFAACTVSVNAWNFGRKETNADRLARGLPPLPPRRLYDATRTGPPLARRSGIAGAQIAVTLSGSAEPLCWVGANGCVTPQSSGLFFIVPTIGTTAQDLTVNAGSDAGDNLIALGGVKLAYTDYVTVFNLDISDLSTAPGADPIGDFESGYYESSIWSVDSGGNIQANWVNPDPADYGIPATAPFYFYIDNYDTSMPFQLLASGFVTLQEGSVYEPVTLQFV